LHVTDLKYGAIACLVGGNKFYHYEIYRNDELLQNEILPVVKNFWEHNVALLIEPKLDGSLASTELINEIGKDCIKNSELVIEEQEYNELAETVLECKARIKELTRIEDEAANRIKDKMRSHELGYTQDYVCKWSQQSQKRIDTDAIKSKYPKIAEECTKIITFRRFTVKGIK
jgi:predicted phage-related endonuclease